MATSRAAGPAGPPPAAGAPAPAPVPEAANLGAAEQQTREVAEGAGPAGLRPDGVAHAASLAEAAAIATVLPPAGTLPSPLADGGPGVGAAQTAERTSGFTLRPTGTHMAERLRGAEAVRRPLISRAILPRADHAVDPDTVPGVRVAEAAGQVRRNGLTYQAGAPVPVDYRAYVELVRVGHILDVPWERLPHHEG